MARDQPEIRNERLKQRPLRLVRGSKRRLLKPPPELVLWDMRRGLNAIRLIGKLLFSN